MIETDIDVTQVLMARAAAGEPVVPFATLYPEEARAKARAYTERSTPMPTRTNRTIHEDEAVRIAQAMIGRAPKFDELMPIARGLQTVKAEIVALAARRVALDRDEPVGPKPVHSTSQDEELCDAYERLAKEAPESVREGYAKKARELRAKLGAVKPSPATDALTPKQTACLALLAKKRRGSLEVLFGARR
ncbi:MAG TPA: hypothetical protein VII82_14230 [Polyangiaceae bacterium]